MGLGWNSLPKILRKKLVKKASRVLVWVLIKKMEWGFWLSDLAERWQRKHCWSLPSICKNIMASKALSIVLIVTAIVSASILQQTTRFVIDAGWWLLWGALVTSIAVVLDGLVALTLASRRLLHTTKSTTPMKNYVPETEKVLFLFLLLVYISVPSV